MTPLTGNRELVLASWRLVETMGAAGAQDYVADRIRCAEAAQAPCEVVVWRMVGQAVRGLSANRRQAGAKPH